MATLAFVAEDTECTFDIIHMGEDLTFFRDGYIYISTHFVLEAAENCKTFRTF